MSDFSTYKKLELPNSPERYNIQVFNKNATVIDSELHKLDLKNQSQDELLAPKTALSSEITRATAQENELKSKIDSEISRAKSAETENSESITAETERATESEERIDATLQAHISSHNNPHNVTKEQLGLENVDNKSSETIRSEITKENITSSLGYTPYTPSEIDNKFSSFEMNIDWKESVATYEDIATTYPDPQDGWTVNVNDTDYTYRYNGEEWVPISANAIPKSTNEIDGLLSKEDHIKYEDANEKKHTHENKTLLDSITESSISAWDNILPYDSFNDLPVNGEIKKIYITSDNNVTYRWNGEKYVPVGSDLFLGESENNAYRGDRGKIAYDHTNIKNGNPHSVTASDIGLGKVENKSSEEIRNDITYDNVVEALGYAPLGQSGLGEMRFEIDENYDLILIAPEGYDPPLELDSDGNLYYLFS